MAELATIISNTLDSGQALDNSTVITVYFAPEGETWTEREKTSSGAIVEVEYTSNGWSAIQQAQAMAALSEFSNVANIQFEITTVASGADFYLTTQNMTDSTIGYFFLPGDYPEAGIGSFDDHFIGWTDESLQRGGFAYTLLLHEFGHGLGMLHPHADSLFEDSFPGVSSSNDTGDYDLNQGVYTVMSYNEGWQLHPDGTVSFNEYSYGFSATPMALDIAMLQDIYGANTNYQSGNTVYQLPGSNGAGTYYSAIWDTGGIDTILNLSATGAIIDLRPATLQVEAGGGGWVSYVDGVNGGYTIAANVVIENATGGSGNDTLIGNSADNILTGNGGDDLIVDSLGDDIQNGNAGNDAISNGNGLNILNGGGGEDLLQGGDQRDEINGGNGDDALRGDPVSGLFGGSDILNGGNGDDILMGGVGADTFVFSPASGNDTIAQFDNASYNPFGSSVVTPNGADFIPGVDMVQLSGFAPTTTDNVMQYVRIENGNSIFEAEGTSITFFQVTGLDADDFQFV